MFSSIISFLSALTGYIAQTLWHNAPYLAGGILLAIAIPVYLDTAKLRSFLQRRAKTMIPGSVAFGALTPLCACGTMAVIFSLMTTALSWGPIMAFLVSSPLMSPDSFILFYGFLGWKLTTALAVSSVLLGLAAGYLTHFIEKRTGYLDNQLRVKEPDPPAVTRSCACDAPLRPVTLCCSDSAISAQQAAGCLALSQKNHGLAAGWNKWSAKLKLPQLAREFYKTGLKKILPLFIAFVVITFIMKEYVPMGWVVALFRGDNFFSVPLAALVGLPLYVSDASVAPFLQMLRDAGASDGCILAFLITGPGTSIGVLLGLSVIMKRRAIFLYLMYILMGGIFTGYVYDLVF